MRARSVAFLDNAASAAAVVVLNFAFVGDRHRLKPAMRMRPDAKRLFARRKLGQRIVVEQKEWAHPLARQRPVREKPVNIKPITHPMPWRRCQNLFNLLYGGSHFRLCFHYRFS